MYMRTLKKKRSRKRVQKRKNTQRGGLKWKKVLKKGVLAASLGLTAYLAGQQFANRMMSMKAPPAMPSAAGTLVAPNIPSAAAGGVPTMKPPVMPAAGRVESTSAAERARKIDNFKQYYRGYESFKTDLDQLSDVALYHLHNRVFAPDKHKFPLEDFKTLNESEIKFLDKMDGLAALKSEFMQEGQLTKQSIRTRFREIGRILHPDKNSGVQNPAYMYLTNLKDKLLGEIIKPKRASSQTSHNDSVPQPPPPSNDVDELINELLNKDINPSSETSNNDSSENAGPSEDEFAVPEHGGKIAALKEYLRRYTSINPETLSLPVLFGIARMMSTRSR